jgi:hypothetical protein
VILAVIALVVLALVVMRILMGIVAREEGPTPAPEPIRTIEPTAPGLAAPELRARADDGIRALLLPAAEPEIVGPETPVAEHPARERSARS